MQNVDIFVKSSNNFKREIEFSELIQLNKDILWVFDHCGREIWNSFIPCDSFTLPYWEYLTLDGSDLHREERTFYRQGALIILLCKFCEYIDIPGGNQSAFESIKIEGLLPYINSFQPENADQQSLKEVVSLAQFITAEITQEDIDRNNIYEHPNIDLLVSKLPSVTEKFIQGYYRAKVN